jgi:hypothetical protein
MCLFLAHQELMLSISKACWGYWAETLYMYVGPTLGQNDLKEQISIWSDSCLGHQGAKTENTKCAMNKSWYNTHVFDLTYFSMTKCYNGSPRWAHGPWTISLKYSVCFLITFKIKGRINSLTFPPPSPLKEFGSTYHVFITGNYVTFQDIF